MQIKLTMRHCFLPKYLAKITEDRKHSVPRENAGKMAVLFIKGGVWIITSNLKSDTEIN